MSGTTLGVVPGGGLPFGGIVKTETPFTDRVTAALLQQQNDRRQYQQQTTLSTDKMMSQELANVRSVDMGTVMDGYGKWKNISMQMFSPRVMADPRLYNELQVQKNAALGTTMASINRSAALNAQAKELVTERKLKPNLYNDDFGDRLAAFNSTPMDKLQSHPQYGDLTNPDAFRYAGSQTNFQNLENTAAGQPKAVANADKVERINDLQTRRTQTEFGATPVQFFENMRGQLAQHIPGRDAAAAWEAVPEQQRAMVDQQFAAISPDKWLSMTGEAKPQVIAPTDPNNPAENFAAYRAKLYAINTQPRVGKVSMETNEQAKLGLQEDERLRTVAAQHANRMLEIGARYANQLKFFNAKQKATDPEATTPTVETIQSMLENPGQVYGGKTAVQIGQEVLSNWNSQGNSKNVQSKLTVVPSFNTPQTDQVKGFRDLQQSGLASVGMAYNALPKEARTQTWGQLIQKFNDPNATLQQKKELLAGAYNQINQANGSPVRFTPEDLDKSVPVLHSRREVDDKFDNTKYQVVKTGTPEFENVINEKRNAVLSSKKPVIQGGPDQQSGAEPSTNIGAMRQKYNY